jgi:hypothetical protein
MLITDPLDQLAVAHARGRELQAEATAERLRGISRTRRAVAGSLRRVAERLDPSLRALRPTFLPDTRAEGR